MRATIISNPRQGNEKRYPLWVQGDATAITAPAISVRLNGTTGAGDAESMTFETLAFVSDMTVNLGIGEIPNISITLNPPYDIGMKFINSDLIEWSTSALEVQFGYADGPDGPVISPAFVGVIDVPDVSFGTDISISLNAKGTAGYYLATTGESGVKEKKTRLAHINYFAQQMKVERGQDLLDETATKLLNEEQEIVTATQSYVSICYELARKCGCWLELSENKLRLLSFGKMVLTEPVAVLAYYYFPDGKLGPESASPGVYPIMSASSQSEHLYLGHYAKKAIEAAQDKSTKTTTKSETDPTKVPGQSKGQALPNNQSTQQSKRSEQPKTKTDAAAGKSAKEAQAEQEKNTAEHGSGVQLEIETLGFPDIIPGMNVGVVGLGKRIDAPYTVQAVKHSFSSSGYTTTLTLLQTSGKLSEALRQAFPGTIFGQNKPATPVASPASQIAPQGTVPVNPTPQSPP